MGAIFLTKAVFTAFKNKISAALAGKAALNANATFSKVNVNGDVTAQRVRTQRIVNSDNGQPVMVWKDGKVEVSDGEGHKIVTFNSDPSALLKLFYEQDSVVIGWNSLLLGRDNKNAYLIHINNDGIDCRKSLNGDPQVMFLRDYILMDYMRLHNGIFEVFGSWDGTHCQLRLGTESGPRDGWIGCEWAALRLTNDSRVFLQGQNGVFLGAIDPLDSDCVHPSEENYKPFADDPIAYLSLKDGKINMRGDSIHLYRRSDIDSLDVFRLSINSTGGLNFKRYHDSTPQEELNFSWNDLLRIKGDVSLPYPRIQFINDTGAYDMPNDETYYTQKINMRLIGGHIDDDTYIGLFRWNNPKKRITLLTRDKNDWCPQIEPVSVKKLMAEQNVSSSEQYITLPFTPYDILWRGLAMEASSYDFIEENAANAFVNAMSISNASELKTFWCYQGKRYISAQRQSYKINMYVALFRGSVDSPSRYYHVATIGELVPLRVTALYKTNSGVVVRGKLG